MIRLAGRLRFTFMLVLVLGASPVRGAVIAQYALGGDTGETSTGKDLSGRSGLGWEATDYDLNVTASNISVSDSIPPSHEDYIEDPGSLYGFPILRFEPGNNSITPVEAVQKDKYFAFTVAAKAGFKMNLSNLTFDAARGGNGTPRGWVVLSSVDGFTNPIDSQDVPTVRNQLTSFTVDLSDAKYQGLTTVTIRIYAYAPDTGLSVEFSNVTLNGTVQ